MAISIFTCYSCLMLLLPMCYLCTDFAQVTCELEVITYIEHLLPTVRFIYKKKTEFIVDAYSNDGNNSI